MCVCVLEYKLELAKTKLKFKVSEHFKMQNSNFSVTFMDFLEGGGGYSQTFIVAANAAQFSRWAESALRPRVGSHARGCVSKPADLPT